MDHKNHDRVFFANFGMVLAVLFAIFFVCVLAARLIDTGEIHQDPAAHARLVERIQPVGGVVTDPAALVKVSASKPTRAPYSGEQVVTKVCSACHGAGVLGAPKVGDPAAWGKLKAASGVDGLIGSAIKGKNAMPPRGGDPDLSDDEVKAAVEHMLKQTGV